VISIFLAESRLSVLGHGRQSSPNPVPRRFVSLSIHFPTPHSLPLSWFTFDGSTPLCHLSRPSVYTQSATPPPTPSSVFKLGLTHPPMSWHTASDEERLRAQWCSLQSDAIADAASRLLRARSRLSHTLLECLRAITPRTPVHFKGRYSTARGWRFHTFGFCLIRCPEIVFTAPASMSASELKSAIDSIVVNILEARYKGHLHKGCKLPVFGHRSLQFEPSIPLDSVCESYPPYVDFGRLFTNRDIPLCMQINISHVDVSTH